MGQIMMMINVGLAIFNLIPIHPLDGSHISGGVASLEGWHTLTPSSSRTGS